MIEKNVFNVLCLANGLFAYVRFDVGCECDVCLPSTQT